MRVTASENGDAPVGMMVSFGQRAALDFRDTL
jgi:hypothetical protein